MLATQGLEAYHSYLTNDVGIANLQQKSAILKNMVGNDQVAREFVDLINDFRNTYMVFNTEWKQRVAFKRAMDRRKGAVPLLNQIWWHTWLGQTYGGETDTVIATTNELWNRLEPGGAV